MAHPAWGTLKTYSRVGVPRYYHLPVLAATVLPARVWATLYDVVGSCQETLAAYEARDSFFVPYTALLVFMHLEQGSLRESSGGNWFHQPASLGVPDVLREEGRA